MYKLEGDTTPEQEKVFWDELSERAYPVTKGSMRLPISLAPFIIKKDAYEKLRENSTHILKAAKKIANAYYTDPIVKEILNIDPKEEQLIQAARNQDFIGIIRLDIMYSDEPKIVEINADYPDGFFMHDITAELIARPHHLTVQNHAALFSDLLIEQGTKKNDPIFIGYNKERTFVDEFYLAKQRLEELGWTNVSVGVFDENFAQPKVLRRGFELSKIRDDSELTERLIEAEKKGMLTVNNFKMRLLGYKSLLAALWDERLQSYITDVERAAIRQMIPETYIFSSCKKELNQNDWVLKPIDLAEGSDVYVGSVCSKEEWATAVAKANRNPKKWIVQQKVTIPEADFASIGIRKYDCNPHIILFKDTLKFGNILVRFSDSEILNVTKGGGITYAFPEGDSQYPMLQ